MGTGRTLFSIRSTYHATGISYHLAVYLAPKTPVRNLTRNAVWFAVRAAGPLLLVLFAAASHAQETRLNVAVGGLPGVGVVAIHSTPTLFVLTRDIAVYGDFTFGDSSRLLAAVGVGGSVQLARILEIVQNRNAGAMGLDVGIRLGPSFYYALADQTAEEEARSFRVMFDPFVRGAYRTNGRVLFVELGAGAPNVRGGVSWGL